ncbi:MAG: tRNA (guanosine(37)-N1)-methyltransferase TrmD [Candidatus Paceibacterota bacterium]
MQFHIITLFPELFESYFQTSILGKAQEKKIFQVRAYQLRQWASDKHHKVDNSPYGGGPGMVLMVDPIYKGVTAITKKIHKSKKKQKTRVILLSTRGAVFNTTHAKRLAKYNHLVFICGRYEGVDERVATHIADEEISIGDVVLSGGEIPAMMIIDAIVRFIPGVLGKTESLEDIKGSYPVYTRPEQYIPDKKNTKKKAWGVPKELLSGNHKQIEEWRKK